MVLGTGVIVGISVGVPALVCIILECINYKIFADRKKKVLAGSVNTRKPHHSSTFTKRWTKYFMEDDHILQLLFDTYYRNLDFNNVDIKDILLIIYEYAGELKPKTVNMIIHKLEEKGVHFKESIDDIEVLVEEIKQMSMDDVVNNFHVAGRARLIPKYKPLICNLLLSAINGITYYKFINSGYTYTETPENIRFYRLEKDNDRPTVVVFPGIGIGPSLYKSFIDEIDNPILVVDVPNVNICRHHFTEKIFLNVIYRRVIEQLNRHGVQSVILFGHSFGTVNSTNFIYNNLRSRDTVIEKVFLADPICFFAGYARLYASIYRYLQNPQRTIVDRFTTDMMLGDIGNQYMFYRQLRPYFGTYHFSVDETDDPEEQKRYEDIQSKTVVMAAQRDSYINYPTLWSHLKKFFPKITRENYYGYHSHFVFKSEVFTRVSNYINSMVYGSKIEDEMDEDEEPQIIEMPDDYMEGREYSTSSSDIIELDDDDEEPIVIDLNMVETGVV